MIKDIMVTLEGTPADETRLAAVETIAGLFQSQVIGLYLNTMPSIVAIDGDGPGATFAADLMDKARYLGDQIEASLAERLSRLNRPTEIRRIDVFAGDIANIAAREARSADTYVALRPNGARQEPERLVEGVLFGSGRHLVLIAADNPPVTAFDRVLVAWNGSRESARALAEAIPYLHKAKDVTVMVVNNDPPIEGQALLGMEAVTHLQHHSIEAGLHRAKNREREIAATLIAEAERRRANLIVMGGYGHSRLRGILLGGVTYDVLHRAPVPLMIAH